MMAKARDDHEEGVRRRKGEKDEDEDDDTDKKDKKSKTAKDPLKWFGVLSPPSLRQSQTSFKSAVELSIDIANLQSEMSGVINRIKFAKRMINKTQDSIDNDFVENLDSKFTNSVKI